ncbi:MAG: GAF domain-containing protein [Bdellovibrionaceae bacterium]|nr:GAF domain-containing protein [Pseudobdellovibrionaceae bacterium]
MKLSQIDFCFHGVVPSKIATCSRDGIPNAAYISHIYRVDDKHVASSFQFFNKTRRNLLENPYAAIQVRDPVSLHPYLLKVKYIRSEESGPVFEQMSLKLDVIASHEGMGGIFRLRAADIYEVLEVTDLGPSFPNSHEFESQGQQQSNEDLDLIRVISDHLSRIKSLEELLDCSMGVLHRYLGWRHGILLLSDSRSQVLVTHATYGYAEAGVGSEVKYGQGLVGVCALRRRLCQIGGIREAFRYSKAMIRSTEEANASEKIPFPGLKNPASQMAAPILSQDDLLGVLMVESDAKESWDSRDQFFISVMTNLLGLGIRALNQPESSMAQGRAADVKSVVGQNWTFRYLPDEEQMFVNNAYLIRNIPAKILKYLLDVYLKTKRTEFSNLELRTVKELNLPGIKDNLEARLILLRKRLDEHQAGVRLRSTGRGKFSLEVLGALSME